MCFTVDYYYRRAPFARNSCMRRKWAVSGKQGRREGTHPGALELSTGPSMAALTFRAPQKGVPRGMDGKAVVLEVVIRIRNVQQLTC